MSTRKRKRNDIEDEIEIPNKDANLEKGKKRKIIKVTEIESVESVEEEDNLSLEEKRSKSLIFTDFEKLGKSTEPEHPLPIRTSFGDVVEKNKNLYPSPPKRTNTNIVKESPINIIPVIPGRVTPVQKIPDSPKQEVQPQDRLLTKGPETPNTDESKTLGQLITKRVEKVQSGVRHFLIKNVLLSIFLSVILVVIVGYFSNRFSSTKQTEDINQLRDSVINYRSKFEHIKTAVNEHGFYLSTLEDFDINAEAEKLVKRVAEKAESTASEVRKSVQRGEEYDNSEIVELSQKVEEFYEIVTNQKIKLGQMENDISSLSNKEEKMKMEFEMSDTKISRLRDDYEKNLRQLSSLFDEIKIINETVKTETSNSLLRTSQLEQQYRLLFEGIQSGKDEPEDSISKEDIREMIQDYISDENQNDFLDNLIKSKMEQVLVAREDDSTTHHDSTSHSYSSQDITKQIYEIVRKEIQLFDADKINRTDYALLSMGGKVIQYSTPFEWIANVLWRKIPFFKLKKWFMTRSTEPETILRPKTYLGECFALKGSKGYVVVRLPTPVYPDGFSIDHVPKGLSPNPTTALKDFRILGWCNDKRNDPEVLLEGVFDYNKEDFVQTFNYVQDKDNPKHCIQYRLEFSTNHGNKDLTCIYRFRIHGKRKALLKGSEPE